MLHTPTLNIQLQTLVNHGRKQKQQHIKSRAKASQFTRHSRLQTNQEVYAIKMVMLKGIYTPAVIPRVTEK